MLLRILNKAITFFNRCVLLTTKEKNEERIGEADLVITLLKHWLYFKIKRSASLVIADSAVPFPLPDRWTNDDKSMS